MTGVEWVRRHGETILAPIALGLVYVVLIITSEANGVAAVIAALVFLMVLGLYVGMRRLRTHANASRLAAIGDPDKLLALVAIELPRRLLPRTRTPLYIFKAMAHNLARQWPEARQALTDAKVKPGERATRSWQLLWAAADVHLRAETGDAAGARATYEKIVVPFEKVMPMGGVELIAAECEARVKLAEGDPAGARALIEPMLKDVRLGAGTRGQLHGLAAEAAAAAGDDAAVAVHAAQARKLAPLCRALPDELAAKTLASKT